MFDHVIALGSPVTLENGEPHQMALRSRGGEAGDLEFNYQFHLRCN